MGMEGGEAAGAKNAASLLSRIYAFFFHKQNFASQGTKLLAVRRARTDGGAPAVIIVPVEDAPPATGAVRKITVTRATLGGESRQEAPSTTAADINERCSEYIKKWKEARRMGSGAARPSSLSAPSIKFRA